MPGMASLARTMALAACVGLFSFELAAFERVQAPPAKPEMTQNCPGLVAFDVPHIIPAALRLALTSEQRIWPPCVAASRREARLSVGSW